MGSSVILPAQGQPRTGPDPSFTTAAIPNIVSFGFEGIDPPSGYYIQRDDVLILEGATQLASDTLVVTVRLLLPYAQAPGQPDTGQGSDAPNPVQVGPGYIQTITQQLALPTTRTSFFVVIPLTEGYLLSVTVVCLSAAVIGATFARTILNRGASTAITTLTPANVLAQGYVTFVAPIAWPAGPFVRNVDGPGFLQQYTAGNPAAGADFSFTTNVPGRVRIVSISALLTTSASVGNRVVSFDVTQSAYLNVQYRVQDTAAVVASSIVRYSLASGGTNVRGAGAIATEQDITLPIPSPMTGRTGFVIKSITQGLLAGDQWSQIDVLTEEWFENF